MHKKIIINILILLFPLLSMAQREDADGHFLRNEFLNKDGELLEDREEAYFIVDVFDKDDTILKKYYYLENAILLKEERLLDGKLYGYYLISHQYGQPDWEGFYKDDKREGRWVKYWVNGNIETEGVFSNHKRKGIWKYYHYNGNMIMKERLKKGKAIGWEYSWFSNGNKFSKGKLVIHNQRHGNWKWYHDNGTVYRKGKLYKNIKVGKWKEYHANGQLLVELNYINDKEKIANLIKEDSVAQYFQNKIKEVPSQNLRTQWQGGYLEGEQLYFYDNGNIASRAIYEDGQLIHIDSWDETGKAIIDKNIFIQEEKPVFKGDLKEFFIENRKELAIDSYIERVPGKYIGVYLGFFIRADGSVDHIEIYESPSEAHSQEAIRLVNLTNYLWEPGKTHQVPIPRKHFIFINFED